MNAFLCSPYKIQHDRFLAGVVWGSKQALIP